MLALEFVEGMTLDAWEKDEQRFASYASRTAMEL